MAGFFTFSVLFLPSKVSAVKFYAAEITSAIAHMHSLRFMHRDLKASNVVLSSSGHTKLIDLGDAKHTLRESEDGVDGAWEKSYTYCGTTHCMAPEMISRRGHTPAVDWW